MQNLRTKLFIFTLSTLLFSTTYAALSSGEAIPQLTPGFGLSFTGFYLQPSASDLEYAVYTTPLPITTPNWTQLLIKPNFSFAFDAGVQYNLSNPSNQLSLDWLYFDSSHSDSYTITAANTSVAPPFYFGPLAQALDGSFASSTATFTVDDVNLAFGHFINVGNHIQLEPFVTLDTAYLKQAITSTYTGTDNTDNHYPYSITAYNTSKFTGIGPRLGLNANYYFTQNFSILAEMAAAALAGSIQTNTNFNSYGAGNHTLVYTTLANMSQTKIVPSIDAALALAYAFYFNSTSSLAFQAGYNFTDYIDGINQFEPTSLVPGAFNGGTIAIETAQAVQSNLELNGPYVKVVWKF